MTIAEIHGKISDTGSNLSERMEDLLTSDIFGCMRYLPADKALIPFLYTSRSFYGEAFDIPDNISQIHYSFWPWLKSPGCIPCQPDVVIGIETEGFHIHLILVEAKYYSGLSSDEDERPEPNDQLARELDNLNAVSCTLPGWASQLDIASRTLLFVTQDMGMPRDLITQSLAEYKRKRNRNGDIFWTSWRFLPSMLELAIEKEKVTEHIAVLEDMHNLVLRKGFVMFHGIEPVTEYFTVPDFYHIIESKYSWPNIPESLVINYTYEVMQNG